MLSTRISTLNNTYINISLAAVYLSAPCLIINEFATNLNLSLSLINVAIFGNIFYIFIKYSKSIYYPKLTKSVLIYFTIILVYLFVLWILLYKVNLFGSGPRSFIKAIILIIFITGIIHSKFFNLSSFLNSFINIAFVLSLSSIILWVGYYFSLIDLNWKHLVGHHPMLTGFGGYLNTVTDTYKTQVGIQIRSQSYFSEPTNFGQYLSLPLFISIWKYISNRDTKSLIIATVISTAFLLTFSIANYFGVIFAIIVFIIVKMKRRRGNRSFLKKILFLMLSSMVVFISYKLYVAVNQEAMYSIIAKGENVALPERFARNQVVFTEVKNNPVGDFSFRDRYHFNPGLIGYLLIAGGFPLLLIVILLLKTFYTALWHKLKTGKYSLIYLGAFAYLPPFLWDGQFVEYYFLFHLVLFSLIMSYDKRKLLINTGSTNNLKAL